MQNSTYKVVVLQQEIVLLPIKELLNHKRMNTIYFNK